MQSSHFIATIGKYYLELDWIIGVFSELFCIEPDSPSRWVEHITCRVIGQGVHQTPDSLQEELRLIGSNLQQGIRFESEPEGPRQTHLTDVASHHELIGFFLPGTRLMKGFLQM